MGALKRLYLGSGVFLRLRRFLLAQADFQGQRGAGRIKSLQSV